MVLYSDFWFEGKYVSFFTGYPPRDSGVYGEEGESGAVVSGVPGVGSLGNSSFGSVTGTSGSPPFQ